MVLQSPEAKYVTDEAIHHWKSSNSGFKLLGPVPVPLRRFLYELCCAVVRGDLPVQKCKAALDSAGIGGDEQKEEVASVLADVVAHLGQDLSMPGECRARFIKMAKWFVEHSLVPSRHFQERCDEEFLWESEMIKIKAQDLKAKEVRVNTRLLYQQTKFNLLREESEGYAKLVTLLCQGGLESPSENSSTTRSSIIKSLIGHFDLDPNRVFDIVLECFELYPENQTFYKLIPMFPKSHAAHILGFKFQYYQRVEVDRAVLHSLYHLTALMVKAKFIDLDSIYTHLLPKDEEAFEHYSEFVANKFEEVHKIGKINLAATGKDLMEDDKQDVTVDLFSALDMEREAVREHNYEVENNQCLGLLMGFLSVDDWYHAHVLFDRLSLLNPAAHTQICEGLFRIIENTIAPAYAALCQSHPQNGGPSTNPSFSVELSTLSFAQDTCINLPRELFQMIAAAGPYFYRDAILLQKVCRVLRAYYRSAQETALQKHSDVSREGHCPQLKEAKLGVEEALRSSLLPSLQLIPANPAVGQEIWELLSLLPYEMRYRLYGEWEKDDEKIPTVLAARQIAKLDTRRILKRLAKDNLKPLGRMVAKLAHANPMTVLRTIVHQIEAYRDMIVPVVDAFKYLTQLEYDILEYVVIERLAQGGREKLKDDGLNLSDWLQSLASFWGHLCKKYPSMELRGLFQYLVNQLKRGKGIELVLLQELIQQMANIQYTENMTEDQLDAMAGSEVLRFQATLFGITRNNKALSKSTNRLKDSLLPKDEPKLAVPLLLLIAQHRSMVILNADAPYIKMVSEQFDRCHGTLLQYVEFLCNAITPTSTYAQLIPPLGELIHTYHLEPEVAFLIHRPVMRLFKCMSGSEVFWPLDVVDELHSPHNEIDYPSSMSTLVLDVALPHESIKWSDYLDMIRSILPPKAWNSLSPDLYATFWGLTLYDIYVPRNRYESEIGKQHAAIKALEEISDNSSNAITKRKKEKERIQELIERLINDLEKHEQHVKCVRQRLGREKDKWLSSCPDSSKINTEFLQRCIFPRCVFSVPDAVYCAMFVHTLHTLGTPFFNMVNHIDVLICKTLHPLICCCTEFEAGRLGRFICETLKIAYHWKSDESVYERECGSMPGFAVYYKFPNGERVSFGHFVKVHWKWSGKITRLLIQCLESAEYMEIRNALIVLTRISTVFPVMRRSGVNLEKRVAKIKGDEREDLKVLATGVAAALASRKSSWVSDEEFGMGYIDTKPAASPRKTTFSSQRSNPNGPSHVILNNEAAGIRNSSAGNQNLDQGARAKSSDGRADRLDNPVTSKSDLAHQKLKADDLAKVSSDDTLSKVASKAGIEPETRLQMRRSAQTPLAAQTKKEPVKDDKSGKLNGRNSTQLFSIPDRETAVNALEGKPGGNGSGLSAVINGGVFAASGKASTFSRPGDAHSNLLKMDADAGKPSDDIPEGSDTARIVSSKSPHYHPNDSTTKMQKRNAVGEDQDRMNKRRKGDSEINDVDCLDVRLSERERSFDPRSTDRVPPTDCDRTGVDEHNRSMERLDKPGEKSKDKIHDKYDKDHREKLERSDKSRSEEIIDKSRDRSMERHGRERSVERVLMEKTGDKIKDDRSKEDRNKPRHHETSSEKLHPDERFHGQNLPPPPPLPPCFVPQSMPSSRRDDDADRRIVGSRHIQRLSPRHDEKERRRSEETMLTLQDDTKRRREDDFREKKRDERDTLIKVEERDKDKNANLKDDTDTGAVSKRRKVKRDQISSEPGEYSGAIPLPSRGASGILQSFDARERGDLKGVVAPHRSSYMEEQVPRMYGKEATGKITRRETDLMHEREWDEEKRQRVEAKRKHRK